MWHCVDPGLIDVSEERIASIFRVEKSASGKPVSAGGCRQSQQSGTRRGLHEKHGVEIWNLVGNHAICLKPEENHETLCFEITGHENFQVQIYFFLLSV
jgi:hypothetical protein